MFSKPITAKPASKAARNCRWPLCWISRARRGLSRGCARYPPESRSRISTVARSNGWPATIAFTRGLAIHHSAMQRSVGKPAVQRAACGPVLVRNIAPHDGAQPLHVEKRVLDFQRIEGPFDQADAARAARRPAASASSMRPTPALRYSGSTPSMWLCR